MKIGIISDIHSNIVALKATIDKLKTLKCDEYFLLGDYISDTPYTREGLDYLYDFIENNTCHVLRGNREEYMLSQLRARKEGRDKERWIYNSASGNLLYTYEQLRQKDFDFFNHLPITFKYEKEGYPSITCCHGSPCNTRELLQLDGDNTKEWLKKIDSDYLISAHTHFPGELKYMGKKYFNPGCVGISINDVGVSQCMFIESRIEKGKTVWKPSFLRVAYDYKKVVKDIFDSGLYSKAKWFVNSNVYTILTGIDQSAEMVELARELANADKAECEWPNIAEEYFERASQELGIPDYETTRYIN